VSSRISVSNTIVVPAVPSYAGHRGRSAGAGRPARANSVQYRAIARPRAARSGRGPANGMRRAMSNTNGSSTPCGAISSPASGESGGIGTS
jgi:hypothetical protein